MTPYEEPFQDEVEAIRGQIADLMVIVNKDSFLGERLANCFDALEPFSGSVEWTTPVSIEELKELWAQMDGKR